MPNHHKVHDLLDAAELGEFEAYAREPGRTVDECHEWMLTRGFVISRGAVGNWLAMFRGQLMQERFSRSGELAQAIKGAVSAGDFNDIAAAAQMQLAQVVFEQATRLEAEGQLDPLDVQRMTKSLGNLIGGKVMLVRLLAEKFDAEMKKVTGGGGGKKEITAEDIAAARKAIFGG